MVRPMEVLLTVTLAGGLAGVVTPSLMAQQAESPTPAPAAPSERDGRWLLLSSDSELSAWVDTERREGFDLQGTRHQAWIRFVYNDPQLNPLWPGKKAYTTVSLWELECREFTMAVASLTAYDSRGEVIFDTGPELGTPISSPPGSNGEYLLNRFCSAMASGELLQ